jgi:hypothetical protein
MSETLTDADAFTATIQMPTSGEIVSAADLRDKAIQPLANRTNYLENRMIDAVDGGIYAPGGVIQISDLRCPTVPVAGSAVANKTYVDGEVTTLEGRLDDLDADIAIRVSSTVVPTYSNLSGVSSVSGTGVMQACRTGDYVMASGVFTVANSVSGLKTVQFTMPYTRNNLSNSSDAHGVGTYLYAVTEVFQCCHIYAVVGAQRVELRWWSDLASGSTEIRYTMGYYIGDP